MISTGNKATRGELVVGSRALQLQPREMVAQRYRQLRTKACIRIQRATGAELPQFSDRLALRLGPHALAVNVGAYPGQSGQACDAQKNHQGGNYDQRPGD